MSAVLHVDPYPLLSREALFSDTPAELNETIAAGAEAVVPFTMWGYLREQRSGSRKIVSVNGTVHFDSAKGSFRREFAQSFREP